jgi:transposase
MYNRHKDTQDSVDLLDFFDHPQSKRQRQYEAVRAFIKEQTPAEEVALRLGYTPATVYTLVRDARAGKIRLFPEIQLGPKGRRTSEETKDMIIRMRKDNFSSPDIHQRLSSEVSISTIERILKETGFGKLERRTDQQRGVTKKNKVIPERSEHFYFQELEPFSVDCPVAGVFFFIPYILESGILEIVRECHLPESSTIGAQQAALSMLLLKLIGNERLSQMERYDQEPGLGIFAGLNVLPKATYMGTYSCRTSEEMLMAFQEKLLKRFLKSYPEMYGNGFINLDFHSIPHFGDLSQMEKVWCGARGKAMKGANTVFAQDSASNVILYTRADILRREESEEIKRFVAYWKKQNGNLQDTLVFDCHFTRYQVLDELADDHVRFITLRKRSPNLLESTKNIPQKDWKTVTLSIPKRNYQRVSVHENEVLLTGCKHPLRQIIVKDHGRNRPTFIITNNRELALDKCLETYAKRWHIENKLSELVSFFNLNALSSPLMIRIHFDILWTMIADTLYRRFARDLRRFEHQHAPSIFNRFINMPGRVTYKDGVFQIKIRKRAHTPILMGVQKLAHPFRVPWLNNLPLEIVWTA